MDLKLANCNILFVINLFNLILKFLYIIILMNNYSIYYFSVFNLFNYYYFIKNYFIIFLY